MPRVSASGSQGVPWPVSLSAEYPSRQYQSDGLPVRPNSVSLVVPNQAWSGQRDPHYMPVPSFLLSTATPSSPPETRTLGLACYGLGRSEEHTSEIQSPKH